MTTLKQFLLTIPELGGRVYPSLAPQNPVTPYALIRRRPAGSQWAGYGNTDVMGVLQAVTVYHKPSTSSNPEAAQAELEALMDKVSAAVRAVDTYPDGVKRFVPGSVSRGFDSGPLDDPTVSGQSYHTMVFTGQIYRS